METQVEAARKVFEKMQRVVTETTGLSAEEQNKLMFEAAYEWLESMGVHGDNQTLITSARQFWGFWKNEWHRLDLLFINWFNTSACQLYNREAYDFFHNPRNKFLQGCITHAGYHQLMKTIR